MDHVSHLDIEAEGAAMLVMAGIDIMSKARPVWTAREIEILREHYTKHGASKCAELLPHRTIGTIHWKARYLKIPKGPFRKAVDKYFTTPHIDAAIIRYYQGNPKRGGLSKLAHQVGRPIKWVSTRAGQLAIQPPRFDSAKWSDDEILLLRKHAAKTSLAISRLFRANGFKRSANAINLKIVRLRCDRTDDDLYSVTNLAELFGIDKTAVHAWIKKGLLQTQIHKGRGDHVVIHHRQVRRFVIENVNAVDVRRVDKYWFVDLVAGATQG